MITTPDGLPLPVCRLERKNPSVRLTETGAQGQTRTADRTIFSRELYQLSYLSEKSGRLGDRPSLICIRHPNAASQGASEPVGDRGLEPLTSTV